MSWVLMRKIPLNQIHPENNPLFCTFMHVLCFGEQLDKKFRNILNAMTYVLLKLGIFDLQLKDNISRYKAITIDLI